MIVAIIVLAVILVAAVAALLISGWLQEAAGAEFAGWDRSRLTLAEALSAELLTRSDRLARLAA